MYSLYCHTNKSNGKKYVGITSGKPAERWRLGEGYKKHRHFYPDIKQYGWEGFTHEIICSNLSRDDAEWLESFYIGYWNTAAWGPNGYDPDVVRGYNVVPGEAPLNAYWEGIEARERGDVLTPQDVLQDLHASLERWDKLWEKEKARFKEVDPTKNE